MNQEEQDKIYQLIQTEDINNWELAYQLIRGRFNRERSNYIMSKFLDGFQTNYCALMMSPNSKRLMESMMTKINNFNILKKCPINNP